MRREKFSGHDENCGLIITVLLLVTLNDLQGHFIYSLKIQVLTSL